MVTDHEVGSFWYSAVGGYIPLTLMTPHHNLKSQGISDVTIICSAKYGDIRNLQLFF